MSKPTLWFIAGVVIGWILAGFGEGVPFSPGTIVGSVLGGLFGGAIGIGVAVSEWRGRRKGTSKHDAP